MASTFNMVPPQFPAAFLLTRKYIKLSEDLSLNGNSLYITESSSQTLTAHQFQRTSLFRVDKSSYFTEIIKCWRLLQTIVEILLMAGGLKPRHASHSLSFKKINVFNSIGNFGKIAVFIKTVFHEGMVNGVEVGHRELVKIV